MLVSPLVLILLVLTPTPQLCAAESNIQQLAVVPFITVAKGTLQSRDLKKNIDCQLNGLCSIDQDTISPAEQALTRNLMQELAESYADALLPQSQTNQHYLAMTKNPQETPRDLGIRLGQELDADHVIVGLIWRYQERVGGTLSAESPASVAFDLFLLNVANKKLVWQGSFSKTQKALSDNLFDASLFFNSGVKWLSAEELGAYGTKVTVRTMPKL
jgi:hypothetical protein